MDVVSWLKIVKVIVIKYMLGVSEPNWAKEGAEMNDIKGLSISFISAPSLDKSPRYIYLLI